jgi:hypothetical protein
MQAHCHCETLFFYCTSMSCVKFSMCDCHHRQRIGTELSLALRIPSGVEMKTAPLAVLVSLICTTACWAAGPVSALVEDVAPGTTSVEAMEYVQPGQVIRLGPRDVIVLTYLHSCVRERIEGGVITVGREMSDVSSGKVERSNTNCDAGRLQLTAEIAAQSAGAVFRTLNRTQDQSPSMQANR